MAKEVHPPAFIFVGDDYLPGSAAHSFAANDYGPGHGRYVINSCHAHHRHPRPNPCTNPRANPGATAGWHSRSCYH